MTTDPDAEWLRAVGRVDKSSGATRFHVIATRLETQQAEIERLREECGELRACNGRVNIQYERLREENRKLDDELMRLREPPSTACYDHRPGEQLKEQP